MRKSKKMLNVPNAISYPALILSLLVVAVGAQADSWSAAGPMNEARTGHVMARIANDLGQDRVLVAGGYNSTAVLASAELYNPFTGAFESVGSMSTPRWRASATTVGYYSILITGGADASGQHLSSAEVFDWYSKAFRMTGSMATARRGHSSTPLRNGRVLVAGGFNGSFISSAEVWDPATGQFSSTGSMAAARRAHSATLLPNGKVLIAGGEDSLGHYLSSAELYDPATGTFSPAGTMNSPRTLPTATLLQDGKVLIAGGYNEGYLTQAELYDPATGTFTPTGSMATPRREHQASLLESGKVVINGGYNNGYPSSVELYDPVAGTFSTTVPLNNPRTWHTSLPLSDGKVLVAGGENSTGYLSSAELYTPDPLGDVIAGPVVLSRYPIAQTSSWETMPRLGNDGVSNLLVFTRRDLLPDGLFGKGDIWYQRLTNEGAPLGTPVQVTNDTWDNELSDVSGDYIVYTSYASTSSLTGRVMVYQISTGILHGIGNALVMQEPSISGTKVVWREGGSSLWQVMFYDLSWLGTAREASILAGPTIPPTYAPTNDVDIGDRFAVWSEVSNGQYDIVAYDLAARTRINLTATPNTYEREASTSGPWITWQSLEKAASVTQILARNMDTGEERVVVDNGSQNFRPSIDGDLIAYEARRPFPLNPSLDIFVYRISTRENFQITNNVADQYQNDVFGNLVAYVDQRNGNADIYVTHLNLRPIANAGADQTVTRRTPVTLDGSASSDPDQNYPLTYDWAFVTKPAGSNAVLQNPQSVNPSFTPDVPGDYGVRLIVVDTLGAPSDPDEVVVSTTNTAPVAEAGPDQAITTRGATVQLDGTRSYDEDGDPFTYSWTIAQKPSGSNANLSDATSPTPTFVADVYGDYSISLMVTDVFGAVSQADTVTISFTNVKPIANAGGNQAVSVGDTVTLNGSGSSDANNDPLTYQWSMVTRPAGSTAALSSLTLVQTSFTADKAGDFIISLVVNDGFVSSDPNNVTVTATSSPSQAIPPLTQAITTINSLSPEAFKNPNMVNALTNKINIVLKLIDQGLYSDALDKLQNDILQKTDGCANTGAPDRNDWIGDCATQAQVYSLIMEAIRLLGG